MANTPQAKKRARQAEKSRRHNASIKSTARTMIKKTAKAIQAGNKEQAQIAYALMQPTLDRTATKGYLSLNKIARHKSRLARKISQISAS